MRERLLELLPYRTRRAVLHRFGKFAPWEPGFDFSPPPLRGNERTGAPDFVGIGAQKAGTTWWHSLVEAHPGVASRPDIHKERHFFSRFASEPFSDEEVRSYHRWFPRPEGRIAGEWTPDYISYPWVAPLLHQAAPDAKLLVILRDPIDRFASGLVHSLSNGGVLNGETLADAINKGFYGRHLESWSRYFHEASMLVLQYEVCVRDPEAQLARTYRFLGLDDTFSPVALREPRSTTRIRMNLDPEVVMRLRDVYADDVDSVAKQQPELDLGLWSNFSNARLR